MTRSKLLTVVNPTIVTYNTCAKNAASTFLCQWKFSAFERCSWLLWCISFSALNINYFRSTFVINSQSMLVLFVKPVLLLQLVWNPSTSYIEGLAVCSFRVWSSPLSSFSQSSPRCTKQTSTRNTPSAATPPFWNVRSRLLWRILSRSFRGIQIKMRCSLSVLKTVIVAHLTLGVVHLCPLE